MKQIPQAEKMFAFPWESEAKTYGAAVTSLKGRVMEWLAEGLTQEGENG